MGEVTFCKTDDGSVGLYNSNVQDIYHSTYGAYSEAYEKFICTSGFLDFIKAHDKVSILDICYGIGYNTKTALNEILKTNKIISVKIDALEYDKNLINISPFLKHQKIDNLINEFIINKSNFDFEIGFWQLISCFIKGKGLKYLNWSNLIKFKPDYKKKGVLLYPLRILAALVHNIYYNYIPSSNKKRQKSSKLGKTSLKFHSDDARKTVLSLNGKYDFIFLDAFTPKKLPTLWTYEFFKELYRLLDDNGVLVTYSSSVAVRSAMIEAGFLIGRSVDNNGKIIGTVAAKQSCFIKHPLQELDKALLKSKAGIYYRDENLNASESIITAAREKEVEESTRPSSSSVKKQYELKN